MFQLFRKKEEITSDEYKKLKKEIVDIDIKVVEMESLLFKISTELKNTRGIMKKKLFKSIEEEIPDSKDLNNSILLPDNGAFKFNR